MSGEDKVRVAVIGAGAWGWNHVRNYMDLRSAELKYVCDPSAKVADKIKQEYPELTHVTEPAQIFQDAKIQGVVIATDAPTHFELAKTALQAGKDVFVEKPLTLISAEARALCEMAEKNGRILMVGHLLLYHPAIERLRELSLSGELGEIRYIYAQRVNLGVVRRNENAWWSLAPHDISVANYLLGAGPVSVNATGSAFLQHKEGIEDVVFATLHYPNGKLLHVHVSWLDPHKMRSITIVGDKKMAVFSDTSPDQKLMIFDKGVEPPSALSYEQGVRIRTGDIRIPALQMTEPLKRECEAFIDAIRTRKQPRADGRSGYQVVSALEAGAKSLRSGGVQTPVESQP